MPSKSCTIRASIQVEAIEENSTVGEWTKAEIGDVRCQADEVVDIDIEDVNLQQFICAFGLSVMLPLSASIIFLLTCGIVAKYQSDFVCFFTDLKLAKDADRTRCSCRQELFVDDANLQGDFFNRELSRDV